MYIKTLILSTILFFNSLSASEKVFSVHYTDCNANLDAGTHYELADNEFLRVHGLSIDEFNCII